MRHVRQRGSGTTKNCNHLADADDVRQLTRRINGGFNGLQERTRRALQAMFVLL